MENTSSDWLKADILYRVLVHTDLSGVFPVRLLRVTLDLLGDNRATLIPSELSASDVQHHRLIQLLFLREPGKNASRIRDVKLASDCHPVVPVDHISLLIHDHWDRDAMLENRIPEFRVLIRREWRHCLVEDHACGLAIMSHSAAWSALPNLFNTSVDWVLKGGLYVWMS